MRRVALSVLAASALALAGAPAAKADHVTAREATRLCREFQEEDLNDHLVVGVERPGELTRGECQNILMGRASPNANNQLAATCGSDSVQEAVGERNKGQCIEEVRFGG